MLGLRQRREGHAIIGLERERGRKERLVASASPEQWKGFRGPCICSCACMDLRRVASFQRSTAAAAEVRLANVLRDIQEESPERTAWKRGEERS